MKNSLKRFITLFMTMAIIASSHGMVFYKHLCTITNIETLSLENKNCGKLISSSSDENQTKSFDKKACCETTKLISKLGSATQSKLKLSKAGSSFFVNSDLLKEFSYNFLQSTYILKHKLTKANESIYIVHHIYKLISSFVI